MAESSLFFEAAYTPSKSLLSLMTASTDAHYKIDYTGTSSNLSAVVPFALFTCVSVKIHLDPRSHGFFIRILVPFDPGMLLRFSTTAFTSRTASCRLLIDRFSWNSEDEESFCCSAIVRLRSLLGDSLGTW